MKDLKTRKEEFVTGLEGGTVKDIYIVTSISLLTYFCYCLLNSYTSIFKNHKAHQYQLNPFSFSLDYLLNYGSILLSLTLYSDHVFVLILGILIPVGLLTFFNKTNVKTTSIKPKKPLVKNLNKKDYLPIQPYLTVYRSQMLILTAIAILAIDFPVFPRRFGKCEMFGTSLMDLGVGSFVFSMGIVSARNSLWENYTNSNSHSIKYLIIKIFKSFKNSLTIFALGIGRFILIKLLNYQEHVSEYGYHWNFFVTLSLLEPLKLIIEFVFNFLKLKDLNLVIAFIIGLVYEYFLINKNLINYLLFDNDRSNLVNQNKEGIFSLIGYLIIFLIGESIGNFLLPNFKTPFNLIKNSSKLQIDNYYTKKDKNVLQKYFTFDSNICLLIYTILFNSLNYLSNHFELLTQPSRRITNLNYVLFVICYNLNTLVGFKFTNGFFKKKDSNIPYSLESINKNGLLFFLISNIFTGLTNLLINTLGSSDLKAILILFIYTFSLNLLAQLLNNLKIYIKL